MKTLADAHRDLERMQRALRIYATTQPLDALSPSVLQEELLAIAGEPHVHRAQIGDRRACGLCLKDLLDPVHEREMP